MHRNYKHTLYPRVHFKSTSPHFTQCAAIFFLVCSFFRLCIGWECLGRETSLIGLEAFSFVFATEVIVRIASHCDSWHTLQRIVERSQTCKWTPCNRPHSTNTALVELTFARFFTQNELTGGVNSFRGIGDGRANKSESTQNETEAGQKPNRFFTS